MTDEQFNAYKTKVCVTGIEAFWISFFVTSYVICLTAALLGD